MWDALILGTERTGTTWLSAILDAHPATEVHMEPLAAGVAAVPGWPGRWTHLTGSAPEGVQRVQEGFAELPRRKYGLLHSRGGSRWSRHLDRGLVAVASGLRRTFGVPLPRRLDAYRELNAHRARVPVGRFPKEDPAPTVRVAKELRMNLQVGLLATAFPELRAVVTTRHPGAQLESIQRLRSRGRLVELDAALPWFPPAVAGQERLQAFEPVLPDPDTASDLDLLATWLLVQYDVLGEDLDRHGVPHEIVRLEHLAGEPLRHAERALEHVGLDVTPGVEAYVRWSSRSGGREPPDDPLETTRDSAAYIRKRIAAVDATTVRAVDEAAARFTEHRPLPAMLDPYFEQGDEGPELMQ